MEAIIKDINDCILVLDCTKASVQELYNVGRILGTNFYINNKDKNII